MSESPVLISSCFCLWDWMTNEVYKTKLGTLDELLTLVLNDAAPIKKMKINSDEQHAIFASELQSALRLTEGFSNNYCEL